MTYLPEEQVDPNGEGWLKSHEKLGARIILDEIRAQRDKGKVITFHKDKRGHYIRVNCNKIYFCRNNGRICVLRDWVEVQDEIRGRFVW